jgi:hypothetical protein
MKSDSIVTKVAQKDIKKTFRKLGTCSRTYFHVLNREFGHPKENEERAADALAGGILQKGHQCGMLWGASMAVGAEAYRRCETIEKAMTVAIKATQYMLASFIEREKTSSCREITHCDFSNKLSYAKYMVSGRFLHCFNLAEKWAPEAIQSAIEGLSDQETHIPQMPVSCASEVARKMGASDEEMVMVAGFAGGLGLSGNACGALSAAIWMKSLAWCREQAEGMALKNTDAALVYEVFQKATDSKILCSDITGQHFQSIEAHAKFIKNGGCKSLMRVLAQS